MNKVQFMIDCETLSTAPDAHILSIGVTKVMGGKIVDEYYARLDYIDDLRVLLEGSIDQATLDWWAKQDDEARKEVFIRGDHWKPALEVIGELAAFFNSVPVDFAVEVWSNGATADIVWVEQLLDRAKHERLWTYRAARCFRTLRALMTDLGSDKKLVDYANMRGRGYPPHHALGDAVWQTHYMIWALEMLEQNAKHLPLLDQCAGVQSE